MPPVSLRLIGATVLPQSLRTPADGGVRFGSVSGLAPYGVPGRWVGVVDERNASRLVWLDIAAGSEGVAVTPAGFLTLREPSASHATPMRAGPVPVRGLGDVTRADLEAIVVLGDGSFIVSDEGYLDLNPRRQPALLHVQPDGSVTGALVMPRHMQMPDDSTASGVRTNLGIEALTRLPDGHLIAGLEQPLRQDDDISTVGRGGVVRLVEIAYGTGAPRDEASGTMAGWQVEREYAYRLDPTPQRPGERTCQGQDGANGLAELLALDATTLLALERSCLLDGESPVARNGVRIYAVSLEGADDVHARPSLQDGAPVRPLRKRLLMDVETLIPQLPPALARLDNFEGLAFGPPVPGAPGVRSILVLTDDNFRATQHTAVLWFALDVPTRRPAGQRAPGDGGDGSGIATKR